MLGMFHPGALLVVSSIVGETISMISKLGHIEASIVFAKLREKLLLRATFCDSLIKFGVPKMTKIFGSNGHSLGCI